MIASDWMRIVDKLRLVLEDTGQPYDLPNEGIMELTYKYHPRLATPILCLNATGMKVRDVLDDIPCF